MCGRYALWLVRRMLEQDDMPVEDAPPDGGPGAPRQSHNFAPSYHGIVYRADVPDWGAGPARGHGTRGDEADNDNEADDSGRAAGSGAGVEAEASVPAETTNDLADPDRHSDSGKGRPRYILQSMRWGLVPSWTKRRPGGGYASLLKTINCRDDSLARAGGMWASMKARKRCVVIAQGFYEWLAGAGPGGKEKVPHYIKRRDGKLMCFAGLWDCVRYEAAEGEEEGEKNYTYTIVTTESNKQLRFLHDRMPVILEPGSDEIRTWLDPGRHEWSKELQALLKPFAGELEVYPVSKEVGKVGNDSPMFVVPVASRENKANIANFFANADAGAKAKGKKAKLEPEVEVKVENDEGKATVVERETVDELAKDEDDGEKSEPKLGAGRKRGVRSPPPKEEEPPPKKASFTESPSKNKHPSPAKKQQGRGKISATSNTAGKSPAKGKGARVKAEEGSQKITKFFANSA